MVELKLVPKREPDPVEAVRTRIKRMARPDGVLQCPVCGGRASCRVEAGAAVVKGRRRAGTFILKDVCDTCRQVHNQIVEMRSGDERPEIVK